MRKNMWCFSWCMRRCVFACPLCGYPSAKVWVRMWVSIEGYLLWWLLVHLLRQAFAGPRVHPFVQFSKPVCAMNPLLLPSKLWNYGNPQQLCESWASKVQSSHIYSKSFIHWVTSPATDISFSESGWSSLKWWSPVASKERNLIL